MFAFSKVLQASRAQLCEEDVLSMIPVWNSVPHFVRGCGTPDEHLLLSEICCVDDVAFPVLDSRPANLVAEAARVAEVFSEQALKH